MQFSKCPRLKHLDVFNCNRQLLIETFEYREELLKNTNVCSLDSSCMADLVSLQVRLAIRD